MPWWIWLTLPVAVIVAAALWEGLRQFFSFATAGDLGQSNRVVLLLGTTAIVVYGYSFVYLSMVYGAERAISWLITLPAAVVGALFAVAIIGTLLTMGFKSLFCR